MVGDLTVKSFGRCNSCGLRSLSLFGLTKISDSAFVEFAQNPVHKNSLVALDIRGCVKFAPKWTNNNYAALRKEFPSLSVFTLHT